jgi:hypothetical protein
MKVFFVLRSNKAKTPQTIRANFRVNGERFFITTHKKIEPNFWSKSKQQVLSGHKFHKELNGYLKTFGADIEKVVMDFETEKIRISQDEIQKSVDLIYKKNDIKNTATETANDFIGFIDEYIISKRGRSESFYKSLRQVKGFVILTFKLGTKSIIKSGQSGRPRIKFIVQKRLDFDCVNLDFIKKFEAFLYCYKYEKVIKDKSVLLHYKKNYIGKNVKFLNNGETHTGKTMIKVSQPN